jgi:hypothetical protein
MENYPTIEELKVQKKVIDQIKNYCIGDTIFFIKKELLKIRSGKIHNMKLSESIMVKIGNNPSEKDDFYVLKEIAEIEINNNEILSLKDPESINHSKNIMDLIILQDNENEIEKFKNTSLFD